MIYSILLLLACSPSTEDSGSKEGEKQPMSRPIPQQKVTERQSVDPDSRVGPAPLQSHPDSRFLFPQKGVAVSALRVLVRSDHRPRLALVVLLRPGHHRRRSPADGRTPRPSRGAPQQLPRRKMQLHWTPQGVGLSSLSKT